MTARSQAPPPPDPPAHDPSPWDEWEQLVASLTLGEDPAGSVFRLGCLELHLRPGESADLHYPTGTHWKEPPHVIFGDVGWHVTRLPPASKNLLCDSDPHRILEQLRLFTNSDAPALVIRFPGSGDMLYIWKHGKKRVGYTIVQRPPTLRRR